MDFHFQELHDILSSFWHYHFADCQCPAGFTYLDKAKGCYKIILESLNYDRSSARFTELHPKAHFAIVECKYENDAIVSHIESLKPTG